MNDLHVTLLTALMDFDSQFKSHRKDRLLPSSYMHSTQSPMFIRTNMLLYCSHAIVVKKSNRHGSAFTVVAQTRNYYLLLLIQYGSA